MDKFQICYNVDVYFGPRPTPAGPVDLLPNYENEPPSCALTFCDPTGQFVLFLEIRTNLTTRHHASPDNIDPDPLCGFRKPKEHDDDHAPFGQINVSYFVTELKPDMSDGLSDMNEGPPETSSANQDCRLTLMTEMVHDHVNVDFETMLFGDLDSLALEARHLLNHGGPNFSYRVGSALARLWVRSTGVKLEEGDERLWKLMDCLEQLEETQYFDVVNEALVELQYLLDVQDSSLSSSQSSRPVSHVSVDSLLN